MLLLNVQQQKLRSQLQFTVRKDTESETVLSYCAELLSLSWILIPVSERRQNRIAVYTEDSWSWLKSRRRNIQKTVLKQVYDCGVKNDEASR